MKGLQSYNIPTVIKALRLMSKRKWLFLTLIFGFCAVEICINVFCTLGTRGAIQALETMDLQALLRSASLVLAFRILWWGYAPIAGYGCDWASKGTVQKLKAELVERIVRMPMRELDRRAKGELLSALTNDIASLQSIYDGVFFNVWRTFLGGIAGLVIMAALDWRFALVVFTLGTVSIFVTSRFNKRLEKAGERLQEGLAKTSADANELIKGAKTIRLLRVQQHMMDKTNADTQAEATFRMTVGKTFARMNAMLAAVNALTYAAILTIGAVFVYFNLCDWATVVAVTGLKWSTDMLFVEFGQHMAGLQASIPGIKRLLALTEVLAEPSSISGISIEPSEEALTLRDIHFVYDEKPVLTHWDMTLTKQGLTALVGESGAGKSTVMKLILGLYTSQAGTISFDGHEHATLESVRGKTAYVPQEPMLFRGSVLENILCGNPSATREDAILAARQAGADAFVSAMVSGYDTLIADDGKSLSGGEKQRIAIARALVKDAPILLLDEVTSALDAETEAAILETIRRIAQRKAVLWITHKQSVADQADCVLGIHA